MTDIRQDDAYKRIKKIQGMVASEQADLTDELYEELRALSEGRPDIQTECGGFLRHCGLKTPMDKRKKPPHSVEKEESTQNIAKKGIMGTMESAVTQWSKSKDGRELLEEAKAMGRRRKAADTASPETQCTESEKKWRERVKDMMGWRKDADTPGSETSESPENTETDKSLMFDSNIALSGFVALAIIAGIISLFIFDFNPATTGSEATNSTNVEAVRTGEAGDKTISGDERISEQDTASVKDAQAIKQKESIATMLSIIKGDLILEKGEKVNVDLLSFIGLSQHIDDESLRDKLLGKVVISDDDGAQVLYHYSYGKYLARKLSMNFLDLYKATVYAYGAPFDTRFSHRINRYDMKKISQRGGVLWEDKSYHKMNRDLVDFLKANVRAKKMRIEDVIKLSSEMSKQLLSNSRYAAADGMIESVIQGIQKESALETLTKERPPYRQILKNKVFHMTVVSKQHINYELGHLWVAIFADLGGKVSYDDTEKAIVNVSSFNNLTKEFDLFGKRATASNFLSVVSFKGEEYYVFNAIIDNYYPKMGIRMTKTKGTMYE